MRYGAVAYELERGQKEREVEPAHDEEAGGEERLLVCPVHPAVAIRHLQGPEIHEAATVPWRLASGRHMVSCRHRQSPPHASGINHLALALALLFTGAESQRRFLFGGSMQCATPPAKTLGRRIAELESLTTSQSRELQIRIRAHRPVAGPLRPPAYPVHQRPPTSWRAASRCFTGSRFSARGERE